MARVRTRLGRARRGPLRSRRRPARPASVALLVLLILGSAVAACTDDATTGSAAEGIDGDGIDGDGNDGDGATRASGTVVTPPPGVPAGAEVAAATAPDLPDGTVYYSDFGTGLGDEWERYDSVGHAGWGLRRPSAITVEPDEEARGGSVLTITARMGEGAEAGQLVSGGIKLRRPRTYGRYTFRMRVDGDPDEVTSGVALLWPESNEWPQGGEIDIVESWDSRATRTPIETNLHWLAPGASAPYDGDDDRVAHFVSDGVDGREWHVYSLDWGPESLILTVDDGVPQVLSTDPVRIPQWAMEPTFQLDAFDRFDRPGEQPVLTGEVELEVDWILIEAYDTFAG